MKKRNDFVNDIYNEYLSLAEKHLQGVLEPSTVGEDKVTDAMKYSLQAGGKRIRPLLCLEFCNLCGGDIKSALDYACAVELVHTYSLIHDDLPCMDNDDMRRGKPSCHIKFGEEYALLAGDALLTYAFYLISGCKNGAEKNCMALKELSRCAGYNGMIGGQTLDLLNENKKVGIDIITKTDILKTSKLIEAACVLGCISAGADEEHISRAREYALNMGVAFQIRDDILDVTSSAEKLGKPAGSDEENDKSTYVSVLGLDKSVKAAEEYSEKAIKALDIFGDKAKNLISFTNSLLKREK